jgi:hypothetical protein
MHRALLGLTLAAGLAVPASAETFASSGFSSLTAFGASRGSNDHRSFTGVPAGDHRRGGFDRHHRRGGFDRDHRRHIRVGDDFGSGSWGYGGGYYDYGDYDANRSFDPDKWNDWWHERPERAFPRWMSRNQDCARPWYSGNVLTC